MFIFAACFSKFNYLVLKIFVVSFIGKLNCKLHSFCLNRKAQKLEVCDDKWNHHYPKSTHHIVETDVWLSLPATPFSTTSNLFLSVNVDVMWYPVGDVITRYLPTFQHTQSSRFCNRTVLCNHRRYLTLGTNSLEWSISYPKQLQEFHLFLNPNSVMTNEK